MGTKWNGANWLNDWSAVSVPVIPNQTLWGHATKSGMNDPAVMGWDYWYERDWREGNN